jgi:hypothetical protein
MQIPRTNNTWKYTIYTHRSTQYFIHKNIKYLSSSSKILEIFYFLIFLNTGVVMGGINCDWFSFYGDMDFMCAFLLSVVVYMLFFTKPWCSVDIGDYYIVVVNGHVLSCMGSLSVN